MDLVCRRYPNRRPSDYLEIEDPYIALQLDYAVAYKHMEQEFKLDETKLQAIEVMIKPIGMALGVNYTEPKQANKTLPEDLYVDEVLEKIGGKGMMINKHG